MNHENEVINVSKLKFSYKSESILNCIDFTVFSGDFVSLIGSNGAGKSTLLKLILGELNPLSGSVTLFGKPTSKFNDWGKIGYVPQNSASGYSNFPASSEEIVTANLFSEIGLFRFAKKLHKEKTIEALRLVGMEDHAKSLIGNLSGGQQQRVMLARALVKAPKLMILDEPATGVDEKTVTSFYELLKKLNKEKDITILMVTHDFSRCSKFVSRTLCLETGTVVELNEEQIKDELSHKHKHPEKCFEEVKD